MAERRQSAERLRTMLREAYDERARLAEKIAGLEAALRDADPGYRALMETLEE